jgi:hypothetical protein
MSGTGIYTSSITIEYSPVNHIGTLLNHVAINVRRYSIEGADQIKN